MDGFPNFGTKEEPPYAPLKFIDPTSYFGKHVPQRLWIVDDWLPRGVVSLSYGDGGIGKTLLAQQLMTSCATGVHWCGLHVEPCRAIGLFCEDDEDEIHRRQDAINSHFGICFQDTADMRWASGTGEDNVLIRFDPDGTPRLTDRFHDLCKAAKDFGASFVLIDTAADTFGGNENDRAQVRQYIGHALTKLARDLNAAVLVNAHPSRSGMTQGGSMDSGSTGWSNSARSRWALTRPDAQEGETVDPNERILTRRKANYSSIGDQIKLRWENGLLVPEATVARVFGVGRKQEIEATFMALLARAEEQERPLNPSKNAGNYAAKVFSEAPDRKGFSKREFSFAMEALLADGRIRIEHYGPPSKRVAKLVTVPPTPDAEPELGE